VIALLKVPTIHLNGTARDLLVEEYGNALSALEKARQALRAITVHGRDYYVQDTPRAIDFAIAEHAHRINRVQDVELEIQEILSKILDQRNNR